MDNSGSAAGAEQHVRVKPDHIDLWGPFTITFHPPAGKKTHSSVEARCPFHALGPKSGCKKYYTLRDGSESHRSSALWAMRHWCNSALEYDRQRDHLGTRALQMQGLPDHASTTAAKITEEPPAALCTDKELQQLNLQCGGGVAVAVAVARPRAKHRHLHPHALPLRTLPLPLQVRAAAAAAAAAAPVEQLHCCGHRLY